ncbi:unnamed protein product [Dicrocoelium dendriticum]|nr:unnamed protein product [Dicrocoelium dendriticum]
MVVHCMYRKIGGSGRMYGKLSKTQENPPTNYNRVYRNYTAEQTLFPSGGKDAPPLTCLPMPIKPSCASALLSTPVCSNLGEAREEMLSDSSAAVPVSVSDFVKQFRRGILCGDSECVHRLLRSSRHPPIDFNADPPPLCSAASKGYADVVGLLLRHGADVNVRASDDSTPLICAADNGHWNVLAVLLNAGASMNLLTRMGETALARATRRGWVHCSRLLLTYGANPHPMATDGNPLVVSPLHLARQMHQTIIEEDILTQAITMENILLQLVKATLPKHIYLMEPGHLVDTKTSSFFPVQLLSDRELSPFVLYFKTPPGYEKTEMDSGQKMRSSSTSNELILIYIVRAQLLDGQLTSWLNGPEFCSLKLSFNGTRRNCKRLPTAPEYTGLFVFSVTSTIKSGGLNTLCVETSRNRSAFQADDQAKDSRTPNPSPPMVLIGAYRVHIDVTSIIQASVGLTFGGPNKPTLYIPK